MTADAPLPLLTWIKADGGGRGFPLRPRLLKCNGNLLASSSNQVAVLSALTSGVPRLLLSYLKKNVLDSDHFGFWTAQGPTVCGGNGGRWIEPKKHKYGY